MNRIRKLLISILAAVMLSTTVFIAGTQASRHPPVLPPEAKVQGLTLGEWVANFIIAEFGIPASENPGVGNPWPECYTDRIGNVGLGIAYFSSGESECEMPTGMFLYVPVVGVECWDVPDLVGCALAYQPVNLQATVDSLPVQNIDQYAALSPLHQLYLPEGNIFDYPSGSYDAVAYATGFLLTPLSPGEHTVHVYGEVPFVDFTYEWTYHITVVTP